MVNIKGINMTKEQINKSKINCMKCRFCGDYKHAYKGVTHWCRHPEFPEIDSSILSVIIKENKHLDNCPLVKE